MTLAQIIILALIQGFAELLPVSSSAHVIVAEKIMGLDPSAPEMTFLLVMLHTGTMGAVLLYFWPRWRSRSPEIKPLVIATVCTGVLGLLLKEIIEKGILHGRSHQDLEVLFSNLPLMAASLAAAGLLIILAGGREAGGAQNVTPRQAAWIGALQGLCLPFRGFSRSGATISAGLLNGISKASAEEFSFALAVILTPAVIVKEGHRLFKATGTIHLGPGLLGMVFSFAAGLGALRWLSSWLEKGRWKYFGYYCLAAAAGVLLVRRALGS